MNTDQKYWDACLIKVWRNAGTVLDAIQMYKSITGKEIDDSLLRTPKKGFPWKIGVRVFVADRLEKISKRLWEQPPEKDVDLLNRLQTSKYTTTEQSTQVDKKLKSESAQYKRNRLRVGMESLNHSNRNQKTDWRVTK